MAATTTYGTGADGDAAAGLRRRTAAPAETYTPLQDDTKKELRPKVRSSIYSGWAGFRKVRTDRQQKQAQGLDIESIVAPILFTLLSFFTRLYRIGRSNIVTWDEAQYVFFLGCPVRWHG